MNSNTNTHNSISSSLFLSLESEIAEQGEMPATPTVASRPLFLYADEVSSSAVASPLPPVRRASCISKEMNARVPLRGFNPAEVSTIYTSPPMRDDGRAGSIAIVLSSDVKPTISYPQLSRQARKRLSAGARAPFAVISGNSTCYGATVYTGVDVDLDGDNLTIRSFEEKLFETDLRQLGSLCNNLNYKNCFMVVIDAVYFRTRSIADMANLSSVTLVDSIKICDLNSSGLTFSKYDSLCESLKKQLSLAGDAKFLSQTVDQLSGMLLELRAKRPCREVEQQMWSPFSGVKNDLNDVKSAMIELATKKLPQLAMEVIALLVDFIMLLQMVGDSIADKVCWKYVLASASSIILRVLAYKDCKELAQGIKDNFFKLLTNIREFLQKGADSTYSFLGTASSRVREVEQQVQKIIVELFLSIVQQIACFIGFLTFGPIALATAVLNFKSIALFCRDFNMIFTASKNIGGFISAIAKYLPDCIKEWIDYLFPKISWITSESGVEYQAWHAEVLKFCDPATMNLVMLNKNSLKDAEALFSRGVELAKTMEQLERVSPILVSQFRDAFGMVYKFRSALTARFGEVSRQEPFHIQIYGPARIGKTRFAEVVAEMLTPTHLVCPLGTQQEIPKHMRIYSRQPGSKFVDGYAEQHTVLYDDQYQFTDGLDAVEMMQWVNKVRMPVECASLDDPNIGVKGTCFTSKLIVSTTNNAFPRPTTISNFPALYGRRHRLLYVRVCRPYANKRGELDKTKVTMDILRHSAHLEGVFVDPRDPHGEPDWTNPKNMIDLLKMLKEDFEAHSLFEQNVLEVDRNYFANAMRVVDQQGLYDWFKSKVCPETVVLTCKMNEMMELMNSTVPLESDCCCGQIIGRDAEGLAIAETHYRTHHPLVNELPGQMLADKLTEMNVVDADGNLLYHTDFFTERTLVYFVAHGGEIRNQSELYRTDVPYTSTFSKWLDAASEFATKYNAIIELMLNISTFVVAVVVPVAATMVGARHIYNLAKEANVPEQQMANPSGGEVNKDRKPKHKHSEIVARIAEARRNVRTVEQHMEVSADGEVVSKVHRNVGILRRESQGAVSQLCYLGVANGVFLSVSHFFWGMREGEIFEVHRMGKIFKVPFQSERLFYFPLAQEAFGSLELPDETVGPDEFFDHRDLVAYNVPQHLMPFFADIRQHFVEAEVIDNLHSRPGYLLTVEKQGQLAVTLPAVKVNTVACVGKTAGADRYHLTPMTLDYNVETKVGSCGSPVVLNRSGPCVAGIHFSFYRSMRTGCAEICTQADLQLLTEQGWFDRIRVLVPPTINTPREIDQQAAYAIDDVETHWQHDNEDLDMIYVGKLEEQCRMPRHHAYRPSVISGDIFEPCTDNSVLAPNDPRVDPEKRRDSPLKKAHAKYGEATGPFNPGLMAMTLAFLSEMFKPLPGALRRILTMEESINGIVDEPYCEKLNMATASGFGWALPGQKGKRGWFEEVDGKLVAKPILQQACDQYWNDLDQDRLGGHLWKATLKTERRPLEKIWEGKTRHFSIAQVFRVIVSRRLNLCFNMNFLAKRHCSVSAAGVNCFSKEWDAFARELLRVSNDVFDIDYSGFDGHCSREMLFLAQQVRNDWYRDEFGHMRDNLMVEEIFRYEVVGDAVYMMTCGNPSGDDGTTIVNTLIGAAYIYYTYMLLVPIEFATDQMFVEKVAFKLLGDDNIIAVAPEIQEYFNPATLQETLASFGVPITSASSAGQAGKTDEVKFQTIADITFLKCGFRFSRELGNVFVPTMAKATIHELTNWISYELEDQFVATVDNCNTALRFALFYGPVYFEDLRSRIQVALDARSDGQSFWLLTYGDLKRSFLNDNLAYFPNMSPTTRAKQMSAYVVGLNNKPLVQE
jgi:hypothetical protein